MAEGVRERETERKRRDDAGGGESTNRSIPDILMVGCEAAETEKEQRERANEKEREREG